MYDFIMSLLSDELLSQAEYIGGVLYLPADAFLMEIASMIAPILYCGLILGIVWFIADLFSYVVKYAYRRFRNRIARGIIHE